MSLESKIEALTAAVVALTAKLESNNVASATPVVQAPAPVVPTQAVPTVAAPVPTTVAAVDVPSVNASNGTQVVMPAAPSFQTSVTVAASVSAPFSDPKGLIDYVMGAYKALGATKGAQIQGVLTGLGYANINDVKPEHYGALHAGVEALKA